MDAFTRRVLNVFSFTQYIEIFVKLHIDKTAEEWRLLAKAKFCQHRNSVIYGCGLHRYYRLGTKANAKNIGEAAVRPKPLGQTTLIRDHRIWTSTYPPAALKVSNPPSLDTKYSFWTCPNSQTPMMYRCSLNSR